MATRARQLVRKGGGAGSGEDYSSIVPVRRYCTYVLGTHVSPYGVVLCEELSSLVPTVQRRKKNNKPGRLDLPATIYLLYLHPSLESSFRFFPYLSTCSVPFRFLLSHPSPPSFPSFNRLVSCPPYQIHRLATDTAHHQQSPKQTTPLPPPVPQNFSPGLSHLTTTSSPFIWRWHELIVQQWQLASLPVVPCIDSVLSSSVEA